MLYVIKFIYQWFLPPACILLLLLAFNIYLYRKKVPGKYFLSFIILIFYFLSVRLGADLLAKPLENWYQPPKVVQGDVILMLGNGSMAGVPDIDGEGQPAGSMAKSMLTAVRMQKQTGLPILISGGMVFEDTGTEADIAKREFLSMGIAEAKLIKENKSRNTVENARFSHQICQVRDWKQPILLVVALQAPRTALIFQREGLNCTIYPTHYRRTASWHFNPILDLVPDGNNLADSSAALREYLGILALKLSLT